MTHEIEIRIAVDVAKSTLDAAQRLLYGWASVVTDKGEPVVDLQGDIIEIENLKAVVHDFMDNRAAGTMHETDGTGGIIKTGRIQDSIVVTSEVAKALGMPEDREGWFVSVKVEDEATWKRVQAGELRAFSIGGYGIREPLDA